MNQPRTEIYLPCSSDDVRRWAANVEVESPIGKVGEDYVQFECTAQLHAGVEITFSLDGLPLHTLAVFGSPNDAERAVEEGEDDWRIEDLPEMDLPGMWERADFT